MSASARSVSEWCGCHNSFGRLNVTGVRLDDCSCRCLSEANLQTLRTKTLLAGALRNRATPLSILETCCVSESGIVSPLHLTRKGSNFPGFSLATSLDECSDNSGIFLSPCSRDPFRGVHQGTRIPTFASPTQKSWKDFSSQSVSLYNASISARLQFQCSTSSLRGEEFCHFFISVVSITEAFKKQKEWVWQPD